MANPYRQQPEHSDLLSKFKSFDAFPKQREEAAEFFHRSVSGGIITICAGVLMTLLFLSELGKFTIDAVLLHNFQCLIGALAHDCHLLTMITQACTSK